MFAITTMRRTAGERINITSSVYKLAEDNIGVRNYALESVG